MPGKSGVSGEDHGKIAGRFASSPDLHGVFPLKVVAENCPMLP